MASSNPFGEDPDMKREALPEPEPITVGGPAASSRGGCPFAGAHVALVMGGGGRTHMSSAESVELLAETGGIDALTRMTQAFYEKVKVNGHLDQFLRSHKDPHATRLASWIAEKMGGGTPWSDERVTRKEIVVLAGGIRARVYDRSSAHVAAWHSPKRPAEDVGTHFQLDDSRAWMRLMFWAGREQGLVGPAAKSPRFSNWFVRFIAHFVRVYEREAPRFARESLRWSEDPANIAAYIAAGNAFEPEIHVGLEEALECLPEEEAKDFHWPYAEQDW